MAKVVISIEGIAGKMDRLKTLQSEYDEITRRIIAMFHDTAELNIDQDELPGSIQEFEKMTFRSKQILEKLALTLNAVMEFERQLNMEIVYAPPRDSSFNA